MAALGQGRSGCCRALTWRRTYRSSACVLALATGCGEGNKGGADLGRSRIPFTHDLDALWNLLSGSWAVSTRPADLAELTEWGVESRYPGEWPEPSAADALRAGAGARTVVDTIEANLRRRGVLH